MAIQITGHLLKIFDAVKVSEKFTKREFVVEIADNPKYPQPVMFQLTGDRIGQLDWLRAGEMVRVDFSLRGREWKDPKGGVRYFNSLDAWTVEVVGPPPPRGGRRDDRDPEWVGERGRGQRRDDNDGGGDY